MKQIEIDEIKNLLESSGLHVVEIDYTDLKSATYLKGSLEDFISAAKAINETVVFLEDFPFGEDHFFYEPNGEILGEYEQAMSAEDEEQNAGINLAQFLPSLEEYKSRVGQTNFASFRIFYKNHVLSYLLYADWYKEFDEEFGKAKAIFEEKENALKQEREREQVTSSQEAERKENELLQLLETLATDAKFVSLSTQKAKQEYALARFPELSELSPLRLKDEISNLNARIQAQKLLQ